MIQLPIDSHLAVIAELTQTNQNLLVQSSPGSGKTTRLPPYLLQHFQKIIVVEPKRIAAVASCHRIAEENQWSVGQTVGYEVRFDRKTQATTPLIFMTEAMLRIKILSDPDLQGIELVIFDEFHERSADTDFCLGHIKELQILGSPVKMVFLTATITPEPLRKYLSDTQFAFYKVELQKFPIEVVYSKKPLKFTWDQDTETNFIRALLFVIEKNHRQILAFLPGMKEIRRAQQLIETNPQFRRFSVEILHGSIGIDEQKCIISNSNQFSHRIVLSTNIAESSVTIDGLSAVVDTGLQRDSNYSTDFDTEQISLRKISLFSSQQRQGRANRQGPGLVYKMWTELDERSFDLESPSDISKSNLFQIGISLARLGHFPMAQFSWFETPPLKEMTRVESVIQDYGLFKNRTLTTLGLWISQTQLSAESAVFLRLAQVHQMGELAALILALLEADIDRIESKYATQSTITDLVEHYRAQPQLYKNVHLRQKQLLKLIEASRTKETTVPNGEDLRSQIFLDPKNNTQNDILNYLLLKCFYRHLGQRRSFTSDKATLFNGKEINLIRNNKIQLLPELDYFLNLKCSMDSNGQVWNEHYHFFDKKYIATHLSEYFTSSERIKLNDNKTDFQILKQIKLGELIFQSLLPEAATPNYVKTHSLEYMLCEWPEILKKNQKLNADWGRLQWYSKLSAEDVAINIEEFLKGEISKGLQIGRLTDWPFDLMTTLSPTLAQTVKREFPLEISFKYSRRSHTIDYSNSEFISLECPLQALLGIKSHPTLYKNQVKIRLVILGPHGRPIQISTDLPSFWKTSYSEIRKEMRGRYPKHAWPEDPENFN